MQDHTHKFLKNIEAEGPDYGKAIAAIRGVSLDEFGEFLSMLPNENYPHLSKLMPTKTPDFIQHTWTGSSGDALLAQSLYFINTLVSSFVSETGRPIQGADVLDFGCGWGRLLRLMLYFCDRENLFGCDAWDSSLQHARASNIPVALAKSETRPSELPFPGKKFDLIYAFSVFTHLPEDVAKSCFAVLRKHIKQGGLLVITVRPMEYWSAAHQPNLSGTDPAPLIDKHLKEGFAFLQSKDEPTWGDASISREYLSGLPGWRLVKMGRSLIDPYQVVVLLRPV